MNQTTLGGSIENEDGFLILPERQEMDVGNIVGNYVTKVGDNIYTLANINDLVRDIILYYEAKQKGN